MTRAAAKLEALLRGVVAFAYRRPRAILGSLLGLTLALGSGLPRLDFETDLLDFLPAGSDRVRAFRRVVSEIDGVTNQEVVWVALDPEKAAARGVSRITDEAAVRAQEELVAFVRERVPEVRFTLGLPYLVGLAHVAAGAPAPSLPEGSATFSLLMAAVEATQGEMLSTLVAGDRKGALLAFLIEGDPLSPEGRDLGGRIARAVEDYRHSSVREHDLFLDDALVPVGLASGLSRLDAWLARDLARLGPVALVLVLVLLGLGFRSVRTAVLALVLLLSGLVWLLGVAGWSGIGLNLVNVVVLPLYLGCAIDLSIHFLNSLASRGRGEKREEDLADAASGSGVALLLTTLTSVLGLLALTLSSVPGMVELGLLAAAGLAFSLVLVLLVPAALAGRGGRMAPAFPPYRRSVLMERLLAGRGRWGWWATLLVLLAFAVFPLVGTTRALYQLDVLQGNFPEGDPVNRAVQRIRDGVGAAFPEFVILEGDVTDPALLEATRGLARRLQRADFLGAGTKVLWTDLVLGAKEILAAGPALAVPRYLQAGGDLTKMAPRERGLIAAQLESLHGDPAWAPLVKLFCASSLDLSVLMVLPAPQGMSREAAEDLWRTLERALGETELPAGARATFLGFRTLSHLFIDTALHWMRILALVSFLLLGLCGGIFLGWRRTVPLLIALGVTGSVWVGFLRMGTIYLSVFLLFPLVFLFCIASDYVVHLLWSDARGEERIGGTTGKAVLLSAVTDGAGFAVFALMGVVSARQVMLATSLAVVSAFVVTVLVVPLWLRRER